MMGSPQVEQGALFYNFSLEAYVPGDHLLRSVDRFVDVAGLRRELAPFYSQTGRPSVDPELMIRMLILGYCFGIRSERGLCDEVPLNLAYRWFCRLGLDGRVPDHSTFSKNATAASATATSCDACLRPCSLAASPRVSSEARGSRSTAA
jgi:transposase